MNDLITLIYTALLLGCFGVLYTSVVVVLQVCFGEGQIFGRWLPWLASRLVKDTKELQDVLNTLAPDKLAMEQYVMEEAFEKAFWYKPLGGCGFCMLTWLSWLTGWAFILYFGLSWLLIFAFPFIAGLIFRVVSKIIN